MLGEWAWQVLRAKAQSQVLPFVQVLHPKTGAHFLPITRVNSQSEGRVHGWLRTGTRAEASVSVLLPLRLALVCKVMVMYSP